MPGFSLTRSTASSLALRERVRRCCRACTLPHFPCCTALTMRFWSRHTIPRARASSRSEQNGGEPWRGAPGISPVICQPSRAGRPELLVGETSGKSARFRGEVMSQPLSVRLPGGIRFLPDPLPARLLGFPCGSLSPTPWRGPGKGAGLPRSTGRTSTGLGALFPPAALLTRGRGSNGPRRSLRCHFFGPGLSAPLARFV